MSPCKSVLPLGHQFRPPASCHGISQKGGAKCPVMAEMWPQVPRQMAALGFESRAVDSGARTSSHLTHSSGLVLRLPASPPFPSSTVSCVILQPGRGRREAVPLQSLRERPPHGAEPPLGCLAEERALLSPWETQRWPVPALRLLSGEGFPKVVPSLKAQKS